MDTADIATAYAERFTERAIEARVRYDGESRTHCRECDDEIPPRRREAVPGVELCVSCQHDQEARACT